MKDQLRTLRMAWDTLSRVPGGRTLFSKAVGKMAPYTGTISPKVCELRKGYARVEMSDHRKVRNHLNSIHAIALMNLAEVASGLAFTYSLPDGTRAILTGLSIDYLKKARGLLIAECHLDPPETIERREVEIEVVTRDESGDEVTRARATWLIGPLD